MCMYACMQIRKFVCVCMHARMHVCVCMHACMYAFMHVYVCMFACMWVDVCVHVCVSTHIISAYADVAQLLPSARRAGSSNFTYVCVCTHLYTYIYTYTGRGASGDIRQAHQCRRLYTSTGSVQGLCFCLRGRQGSQPPNSLCWMPSAVCVCVCVCRCMYG